MSASHYEWPHVTPGDNMRVVHHRAAVNLLLGAIKLGKPELTTRAYNSVTAFLLRSNPQYAPLDCTEVSTLLGLFEAMPGGLRTSDQLGKDIRL